MTTSAYFCFQISHRLAFSTYDNYKRLNIRNYLAFSNSNTSFIAFKIQFYVNFQELKIIVITRKESFGLDWINYCHATCQNQTALYRLRKKLTPLHLNTKYSATPYFFFTKIIRLTQPSILHNFTKVCDFISLLSKMIASFTDRPVVY